VCWALCHFCANKEAFIFIFALRALSTLNEGSFIIQRTGSGCSVEVGLILVDSVSQFQIRRESSANDGSHKGDTHNAETTTWTTEVGKLKPTFKTSKNALCPRKLSTEPIYVVSVE
jgi:hypothetical protein